MTIWSYASALQKQWKLAVAVTVLGLLTGTLAAVFVPRTYTSSLTVYISAPSDTSNSTAAYQGSLLSQERVKSYEQLIYSPRIAQETATRLGPSTSVEEIESSLSASSISDTVLLNISASSRSASESANIANAAGASFVSLVADLERPQEPNRPPVVSARIVAPADIPVGPTAPNVPVYIVAGLLLGGLLGVAMSILRASLDKNVRSSETLEAAAGAPVLGSIPLDTRLADGSLTGARLASLAIAEDFRFLRANLEFLSIDEKKRSVLVTSSVAGEGKSTVVCALALAAAASGYRTLILDADLRRPRVADYLGLEAAAGLSDILTGRLSARQAAKAVGSNLQAITSGQTPPNPNELLGSRQMAHLLRELESTYDLVLVDSPPTIPVSDAVVLSKICGNVVVVCRADRTKSTQLELTREALSAGGSRIAGSVLNMVRRGRKEAGYYSHYYGDKEHSAAAGFDHVSSYTAVEQMAPQPQMNSSSQDPLTEPQRPAPRPRR